MDFRPGPQQSLGSPLERGWGHFLLHLNVSSVATALMWDSARYIKGSGGLPGSPPVEGVIPFTSSSGRHFEKQRPPLPFLMFLYDEY